MILRLETIKEVGCEDDDLFPPQRRYRHYLLDRPDDAVMVVPGQNSADRLANDDRSGGEMGLHNNDIQTRIDLLRTAVR